MVKTIIKRDGRTAEFHPEKIADAVEKSFQACAAMQGRDTAEKIAATVVEKLESGAIDFVTFTSSSTVENLVKLLGGIEPLAGVKTACIGPVTAETARRHGIEPAIVASTYTIEGLVEAMRESLV